MCLYGGGFMKGKTKWSGLADLMTTKKSRGYRGKGGVHNIHEKY